MSSSLWDRCNFIAELSFKISRHYRRLFNHENLKEESDHVMHDLAKFCGAYDINIPHNQQHDIAPLELARRAGRLEVYQHIMKLLRMTEAEKQKMASRLFALEQQQQNDNNKFI